MRATALVFALAVGCWPCVLAAQSAPVPAVISAEAEMKAIARGVEFTGRVVATQRVDLRARVSGFLEAREFEEGAEVAAGDVLFRVERGPYEARVAEIEGRIASATAELNLAQIERDRRAVLVERGSVAQSQLDVADAELGRTEGRILELEGTLQTARLELSYTEIRAPFDGLAGLSVWDVGALVGPDSGALVTVVRQDPMTVEFAIPAAWAYRLRDETPGDPPPALVRLRLPDGRIYDRTGRIDFVDVKVNAGTDGIVLRATFDNPDDVLIHGALVGVLVSDAESEPELTIPQQAVQRDLEGAFVLIVDAESFAQRRRVVVSRYAEGRAVIESGLEPGETVIVEGLNKARPGRPVDAAPAAAPDAEDPSR